MLFLQHVSAALLYGFLENATEAEFCCFIAPPPNPNCLLFPHEQSLSLTSPFILLFYFLVIFPFLCSFSSHFVTRFSVSPAFFFYFLFPYTPFFSSLINRLSLSLSAFIYPLFPLLPSTVSLADSYSSTPVRGPHETQRVL